MSAVKNDPLYPSYAEIRRSSNGDQANQLPNSEADGEVCVSECWSEDHFSVFPELASWCEANGYELDSSADIGAVDFNTNQSIERSTKGTYQNAGKRLWEYFSMRGLYKWMLAMLECLSLTRES